MNITDILERKEFKELDNFLNDEMGKYAGEKVIDKMTEVFGNRTIARDWFYSNALALGDKRPYDYCKEGKKKDVEDLLGRIEYGSAL